MRTVLCRRLCTVFLVLLAEAAMASICLAQSSSLYGPPGLRAPLSLEQDSFLFQKVEPPAQIQLQSIVTIIVSESSQVVSEGEVTSRQQASIDARLQDWLKLDGVSVQPAPQNNGDPRIRASLNKQNRANAELETTDSLRFRIAAHVVDIRPNGNLVIEARRKVENNEERWEQSLTGVVRREDVLPNNTVLSEDIADLQITKREFGHVRDSYKRGWLFRIMDRYKAF